MITDWYSFPELVLYTHYALRNTEGLMPYTSLLHHDPTDWLLEDSNPSVRYFALRWLLDQPETSSQVAAARQAVAESAPVQKILKRLRPEGYWGSDPDPHSTRGPLMLLHWLGAPPNAAICKALDYRINGCLDENGAYRLGIKRRSVYLPCHGAELLRQMLWFGYEQDPHTRKLLDWLVSLQQPDGVWPCVSKVKPFPCMWATADVLRAFRDLPGEWLTPEVIAARDRAVELFLRSNLSQYGKGKADPRWFQFGYPLQWDSDILEVLELVAPFVSAKDVRIQPGLELVSKKQDPYGRWPCEKQPKGGKWMQAYLPLEEIGQPSKWVTLHALRMIKIMSDKR